MSRWAPRHRRDDNHTQIVRELAQVPGVSVWDTSQAGGGGGDIVVGYRGRSFVFEIKDGSKPPSKRALSPDEERFHAEWRGHIRVVTRTDEILADLYQHDVAVPVFT